MALSIVRIITKEKQTMAKIQTCFHGARIVPIHNNKVRELIRVKALLNTYARRQSLINIASKI